MRVRVIKMLVLVLVRATRIRVRVHRRSSIMLMIVLRLTKRVSRALLKWGGGIICPIKLWSWWLRVLTTLRSLHLDKFLANSIGQHALQSCKPCRSKHRPVISVSHTPYPNLSKWIRCFRMSGKDSTITALVVWWSCWIKIVTSNSWENPI